MFSFLVLCVEDAFVFLIRHFISARNVFNIMSNIIQMRSESKHSEPSLSRAFKQ